MVFFFGNSNDHWTFDFERTGAKVYLQTIDNGAGDYDLHLFGTAFGGKDIGGGYLGGSAGFWGLDFTYSAAVTIGLGSDNKSVLVNEIPDGSFAGISTPNGCGP